MIADDTRLIIFAPFYDAIDADIFDIAASRHFRRHCRHYAATLSFGFSC